METFPYSPFYIFFDQYSHIVATSQEVLGLGLASILAVSSFLLGSWRTGMLITTAVSLTLITIMGVMATWGIMLNAISLVNLVISLGIAVEFCVHVARAFMGAGSGLHGDYPVVERDRDERVLSSLVDVGPSVCSSIPLLSSITDILSLEVLSGVTFTKLIGMTVLAFTRSKLLEVSNLCNT